MSSCDIKKEKKLILILTILGIIWIGFFIHNSITTSYESDKLKLIINNQSIIIENQLKLTTNEVEMMKEHQEIISNISLK